MSSGGGGSSGSTTTTSTNELDPDVKPYTLDILERNKQLGLTSPLYRPDFNAYQQQGISSMAGAAGDPYGTQGAYDWAAGQVGMSPEARMAEVGGIAAPFIADALPAIGSSYAMQGREGSGLAAGAAGEAIGSEISKAYLPYMQLQGQAANLMPGLEQGRYAPGNMLFDLGSAQESQRRGQVEERWDRSAREAGIAYGNPLMGTGTTTGIGPGARGPSGAQTAIGAIGALGSLAGGFGSSARYLKDVGEPLDAAEVLESFKGMRPCQWVYKNTTQRHQGPMADEWQKVGASDGEVVWFIDALGALATAVGELGRDLDMLRARRAA